MVLPSLVLKLQFSALAEADAPEFALIVVLQQPRAARSQVQHVELLGRGQARARIDRLAGPGVADAFHGVGHGLQAGEFLFGRGAAVEARIIVVGHFQENAAARVPVGGFDGGGELAGQRLGLAGLQVEGIGLDVKVVGDHPGRQGAAQAGKSRGAAQQEQFLRVGRPPEILDPGIVQDLFAPAVGQGIQVPACFCDRGGPWGPRCRKRAAAARPSGLMRTWLKLSLAAVSGWRTPDSGKNRVSAWRRSGKRERSSMFLT